MVGKVSFTAVADKGGVVGPYDGNRTLVFNTAITSNRAYDPTSGVFRAPLTGYYLFSFYYQTRKEKKSGLFLVKSSQVIVKTFNYHTSGDTHTDNGGNIAIVKLNAGEEVSVQLPAHCCVMATGNVTTFSGFLIAEE